MKIIITERQEDLLFSLLTEGKNKPTNPKLWAQCLAWARSRYDVCPSAYCNGAAAKRYKSKGGGWRKVKKSTNESEETNEASSPAQQAAIAINMKKKGVEPKNLSEKEMYEAMEIDESKNTPTNPKLWASSLAWARSKYDVCPSAYCNGAAAKHYKAKGGGWKKCK